MEFNFSIKRTRQGSQHIQKSGVSSEILSKIQDLLNYRPSDYGDTLKYIQAYTRNPLVYTIVNKVASNAAALPKKVVNKDGEEVTNSKIEEILENPNDHQSRGEFEQQINEFLLLSGNSFIRKIKGIGAGYTLEVLETQNVTILIDKFGGIVGYKYTNNVGKIINYELDEIIHIRISNSLESDKENKYWGLAPLNPLWEVVLASSELFCARTVIWKNKGVSNIVTNKSDVPMLPKERERVQKEFNKDIGGATRANGVHVSPNDLGVVQLGMNPSDLKLIEGGTSNMRILSAGYKMPSILFNDTDNSTYNNIKESKVDANLDAYIPLANRVDEKISKDLSKELGVDEKILVDITRVEVLKSTTNEVATRLNNLPNNVAARVMETLTLDEAREIVGLDSTTDGSTLLGASNSQKTTEDETK